MPTPTSLSTALIVATLLPLLLGVVNQMVQSKLIFGQWPLPTKFLPYLTVFGGFLTGTVSYISAQSPFVLNSVTVFMMLVAGVYSLVLAQQAGNAMHHLGAAINARRPPSLPSTPPKQDADKTDPPAAPKTDPTAVTEVPPPPAS